MNKQLSTSQAADVLGIRIHQLQYALANRRVPEPVNRIAGHRVFEQEDIVRLARYFKVELAGESVEHSGQPEEPKE